MKPAMVMALGVVGSAVLEHVLLPAPKRIPVSLPFTGTHGLASGIAEREAQILALVTQGAIDASWTTVTSAVGSVTAMIPVMRRALAVVTGDGRLTVSVSYTLAQVIADLLGAHLLTSRVADLIYTQADLRLPVLNQPRWVTDGTMAKTERMVEYSSLLDARVKGTPRLVANEGKHWVITSRNFVPPAGTGEEKPEGARGSRHNGANFGWHASGAGSRSPGGLPVIQSIGLAHDRHHADYSQLLTLMGDTALVGGVTRTVASIASDHELYPLVTDEHKPLPALRHPDLGGMS